MEAAEAAPDAWQRSSEVTIVLPDGASGSDVAAAVRKEFGDLRATVNGVPIEQFAPGKPPLVNGAVIVLGGAPARQRHSGLVLAVLSGPDAGAIFALGRGCYRIGRSNSAIRIGDPSISRHQADLVVGETGITLRACETRNPTTLDGVRVDQRAAGDGMAITTGTVIGFGNTSCALRIAGESAPLSPTTGTALQPPLMVDRPTAGSRKLPLMLTALLPLVLGVVLALATGTWMFLAFSGVSAVTLLVPMTGDRKRKNSFRAALARAARDDLLRRHDAAPSSADYLLASEGGHARGTDAHPEDTVQLRLGLADLAADVGVQPPDPEFTPPILHRVPLVTGLDDDRQLNVVGPEASVDGLVRSLVLQLSFNQPKFGGRILLFGPVARLPLAARYLPAVTLLATAADLAVELRGSEPTLLIALQGSLLEDDSPNVVALLGQRRRERSLRLIRCSPDDTSARCVTLAAGGSVYRDGSGLSRPFTPDLVSTTTFDRYCRMRAASSSGGETAPARGIPSSCSLAHLVASTAQAVAKAWSANLPADHLPLVLGVSASGELTVDLCTDGPHLLVAGTTGAGKSELLRSLVASAAVTYPPGALTFLFLDFKGGSGLGPLTGLPHCVGMLTDLAVHAVQRALVSLRAEIRRREALFAAVGAADLPAYQRAGVGEDVPHLVIVVDEFRILLEEVPDSMRELLRVAATGRSLGIHLVLATQRPQGAISADIRANVTTSIALRTQSAMESHDVIESAAASAIPLERPGRAFVKKGPSAPIEFQTASLSVGSAPFSSSGTPAQGRTVRILTAIDALTRPAEHALEPAGSGSQAVVRLCREVWEAEGSAPVRAPVAPALPDRLPFCGRTGAAPHVHNGTGGEEPFVRLGVMDVPEEQSLDLLSWRPEEHSHLALVGGPAAGAASALQLAVGQLIAQGPSVCHLHILDGEELFPGYEEFPGVGVRTGLHELKRAARLLERLNVELDSRRRSLASGASLPLIVLAVSGWGNWLSALRSSPLARAEDAVQDIVRNGPGCGVAVIMSGERELIASRFVGHMPCRLFFPMGSTAEGRLAWPRLPEVPQLAGRTVAHGPLAAGRECVAQLFDPPRLNCPQLAPLLIDSPQESPPRESPAWESPPRESPASGTAGPLPLRILPLPERIDLSEMPRARCSPSELLLGIGGDEWDPAYVRFERGVLLAIGGPRTGKSAFLRTLPLLNPGSARRWLGPPPGEDPDKFWSMLAPVASGTFALVDDIDRLGPSAQQRLAELAGQGLAVVATAASSPVTLHRVPLALLARGGPGLVLGAGSLSEGDFFGIRLEPDESPMPGRAHLIEAGKARALQLPYPPDPEDRGPRRR